MKNTEIFNGKAMIYHKYRSLYPRALFDYLYSEVGFSKDSIIADIGSGTGIFSRFLVERESLVYCIEPNFEMRQIAEKNLYNHKNFFSVNALAEKTGLKNHSLDFITVAQAFHWFDIEAFKTECQRILKPNGKVIIIINVRDYSSEFIKKDYLLRKKYCAATKGLKITGVKNVSEFFLKKSLKRKIFRNDLFLNKESYLGLNLSRSYAPNKITDPDKYEKLVKGLNELFEEKEEDGTLFFPQLTKCYIGRV